jgi:hypothetical protein
VRDEVNELEPAKVAGALVFTQRAVEINELPPANMGVTLID